MKAVICPAYGPPEILKMADLPKPSPRSHEVLIKIMASTVTVADRRIRAFDVPKGYGLLARIGLGFFKPRKPVLGVEWSGIIEGIGSKVERFKMGDEVFGESIQKFGGYQEYICFDERKYLALKPPGLTFEEAAAIPVGAQTALYFLKKADVQRDQKVLIYGASGSVGTYAVQLAKLMGAQVTAVAGSSNQQMMLELGADICLDYSNPIFETQLEEYDCIFVAIDALDFETCLRHLKSGGAFINIVRPFKSSEMRRAGQRGRARILVGDSVKPSAENLEYLASLVADKRISVLIDRIYPIAEIVEAHRYVDTGRKRGNVIIRVAGNF